MLDTPAPTTLTTSTGTSNPVATITNNSSVDVDIYDVFNPTDNNNAVLTYTKLGSVKHGETAKLQTLHLASQLQAMYTGPVAAINGNYYYQFPVAVMAILSIGSRKKTSYTITDDDKTGMEQSFLFQKYVSANPDSQMAKDFVAALNNSTDQEKAVNAFFAGTRNFKACSLSAWTSVMTWMSQFISAWQGTYYLYSVPAQGSTDVPQLIASVGITSTPGANTATLIMNDSGQSAGLVMNGTGLEEADVGQGGISASLKPAWINIVQTSTQGSNVTTSYLVGAALAGVINGTNVSGTGEKRVIPDSSDPDKQSNQQQSATNFDNLFNKITTLIGLGVSILTAYFFYKQLKQGHTQDSNKAAEKEAKKPDSSDKDVDDVIDSEERKYDDDLNDAPSRTSRAFSDADEEVPLLRRKISQQKQADAFEDVVNDQVDKLSDVLEKEPASNSIEQTASDLSNVQTELQNLNEPSDADVARISGELSKISSNITTELQNPSIKQAESDALDGARDAIKDGQAEQESIKEANERVEEQVKESSEKSDVKPDELAEEPKFDSPVDV